jgi:HK97 family phage prohead protease
VFPVLKTKQLEATVTATDEGTFTALASAYSTDRQGERVVPGAFGETIRRWQESGKDLPLAWDHGRDAADIIGSVDPESMRETDAGLYVEGRLDLEYSELAREAWRSVKAGRVGLSFGYLVEEEQVGPDGAKELLAVDIFEVTLTSTPANGDTKILSAKSMPPISIVSFEIT